MGNNEETMNMAQAASKPMTKTQLVATLAEEMGIEPTPPAGARQIER